MANPMANSLFGGLRVMTTVMVGEPYQDWSGVRSPSRAARRLKRGHRQNIVTGYKANGTVMHDKPNGVIYIHPSDYYVLLKKLEDSTRG